MSSTDRSDDGGIGALDPAPEEVREAVLDEFAQPRAPRQVTAALADEWGERVVQRAMAELAAEDELEPVPGSKAYQRSDQDGVLKRLLTALRPGGDQ